MKSFKQYITELFDSHYEYKKEGVTKGDGEEDGDVHHYSFEDHEGKKVRVNVVHWPNNKVAEVWFHRNNTTAMTHDAPHHAHKILGTVLNHIAMNHAREHPSLKTITYTSSKVPIRPGDKETSRSDLYGAITKKLRGKTTRGKLQDTHFVPVNREK